MLFTRRTLIAALAAIGLMTTAAAQAAPVDPPQNVISAFYDKLIGVMKDADRLGFDGRYKLLEPVVNQVYNLPLMARVAVGAQWSQMTADQQGRIIEGFRRYTIATYASRFDGYDGERFDVNPVTTQSPSGDTLVETKVVPKQGETIALNYLMRSGTEGWQVVDVFLSGTISELATRRSEFTSVLRREGTEGLLATLDKRVKEMSTN